jgi:hypothetical protein
MLAAVSESFVDLSYRGLPLGRRIKLTQVRPTSGYLELATPMPVGSTIVIATDDGASLEATVTQIFEQIGGSDRVPGMIVAPALADDAAAAWWRARTARPELADQPAQPPARSKPLTVRPRSSSTPAPVGEAAAAVAAPPPPVAAPVDDNKPTSAMAPLSTEPSDEPPEPSLVDDGKKTIAMASVDLSALGLDPGASGQLAAVSGEFAAASDGDGDEDISVDTGAEASAARAGANGDPRETAPPPPSGVGDKQPQGKKRKKRR